MYNRVYKYNPSNVFLLICTNKLMKDDNDKIILDGESGNITTIKIPLYVVNSTASFETSSK